MTAKEMPVQSCRQRCSEQKPKFLSGTKVAVFGGPREKALAESDWAANWGTGAASDRERVCKVSDFERRMERCTEQRHVKIVIFRHILQP